MPWGGVDGGGSLAPGGGGRPVIGGGAGRERCKCSRGAPEIILQTWLVVGALWVLEFFFGERFRGGGCWGRVTGLGGGGGGVGGGAIAAVFLDLLAHSQRDVSYGGADWDWAMPRTGWANYPRPTFSIAQTYHGMGVFSLRLIRIGPVLTSLGAGVIGPWRCWRCGGCARARAWLLGGLALLSLNLAFGRGTDGRMGALKEIVPQVGFMR